MSARCALVFLAGAVWWRASTWIGVDSVTAAYLGAVAAIILAGLIARASLL